MIALEVGRDVPEALAVPLREAAEGARAHLGERWHGGRVTVLVGADPQLAAAGRLTRRVLVPAVGPGPAPPWLAEAVCHAHAVVLTDPSEAGELGVALRRVPVLSAELPPPRTSVPEPPPPAWLADEWEAAAGAGPHRPWLAWGRGAAPMATALAAWAAGHPVVALDPPPASPLARAAGAVVVRSPLQALEAAALVSRAAPLAATLVARGRALTARRGGPADVAAVLLEAAVVALSPGAATGRERVPAHRG